MTTPAVERFDLCSTKPVDSIVAPIEASVGALPTSGTGQTLGVIADDWSCGDR